MDEPRAIPVTLFTKPGCHLCEDAADYLEALAERWPLRVTTRNILDDPELHRRYWDKIPVIDIAGEMLCAPIAPARLAAAVARAGARR